MKMILNICFYSFLMMTLGSMGGCATYRPEKVEVDGGLEGEHAAWVQGGRRGVKVEKTHRLEGKASWYGEPFHGRRTASGEVFDMYQMTAAHRTLPFGTVVEVRRVDTGGVVVVKITDRGPFVEKRVIDLSYGAAERLGMVKAGVVSVKVEVVRLGEGKRKKKKK